MAEASARAKPPFMQMFETALSSTRRLIASACSSISVNFFLLFFLSIHHKNRIIKYSYNFNLLFDDDTFDLGKRNINRIVELHFKSNLTKVC
jgi:hypothetical protein